MKKYNSSVIADSMGNKLKVPQNAIGKTPSPGNTNVRTVLEYGIYDVFVTSPQSGLIQYEVKVNKERAFSMVTAATLIVLSAMFPELTIVPGLVALF